jgi:hypothetical protein
VTPLSDEDRWRRGVPSPEKLSDEERARLGIDLADPEPVKPQRPDLTVMASSVPKDGRPVLTDTRGHPIEPSPGERRWIDWDRRRRLRAELFVTATAREMSLAEVAGLRHKAATLSERAAAEEARGRPAHARRLRAEADQAELGAERREGRAVQELAELKRLQVEARKAGCSKIGSWLRRAGGDMEPPPSADVAGSVH